MQQRILALILTAWLPAGASVAPAGGRNWWLQSSLRRIRPSKPGRRVIR